MILLVSHSWLYFLSSSYRDKLLSDCIPHWTYLLCKISGRYEKANIVQAIKIPVVEWVGIWQPQKASVYKNITQ